jgi:hypothetical protein
MTTTATENVMSTTALLYAARDLAVLPLDGKTPVTAHGVKDATTDRETIERWFSTPRNVGIAIPVGVVIVDIDPRNGGMRSFADWCDSYGEHHWADVPCAFTGGGGYHYWFRMPASVTKLTKNPAAGIDLLTHGRYVVAPPSVTDKPYRWGDALPEDLSTLPELPGFIAVLARVEDRLEVVRADVPNADGVDVIDVAAHRMTDWFSLLHRHGWQVVGSAAGNVDGSKWRHPTSQNRISATIRHDCLFVYSPNTPFPVTEPGDPNGVTLFSALEILDYGGDRKRCVQALRDAGYLPEAPTYADDFTDLLPGSGSREGMRSTFDASGPGLLAHDLPRINVSTAAPRDLAERAWGLLRAANVPERLFVAGGRPVRLERDDDGWPVMQPLTLERTLFELSYIADWYRPTLAGTKPVAPPHAVAKQILATPELPLSSLVRLVEAPVFGPDGSLQITPGYHAGSRTLYVPSSGFVVPPISDEPTAEELQHAKREINELLCDFPFADESSYAHAVALMILPFVRDLIEGPTPLHLFDKPVPGSGASLLVHVLLAPALGHAPPFGTDSNTDEEWRKRITSALMQSPMAVVLDNLTGELRSPALMAAITSTVWEDRILGRSELGRWPVRCVWVATSNNLTLKRDLVRRTVYCRLDPNIEHPEDRGGFRHELPSYAYTRRSELVWAVLTSVRRWLALGSPRPSGTPLGSFEEWSRVIGGILEVLEIPGFLDDRETLRANTDTENECEQWLLEQWWGNCKEEPTTTARLFNLIAGSTDVPADLVSGTTEQAMRNSLGTRMRSLRDRVFTLEDGTVVRVTKGTKNRGVRQWHLRRAAN